VIGKAAAAKKKKQIMETTEMRTSRKTDGNLALAVEVKMLGDNVIFRRLEN
jgi:hypothetical protein